MVDTPSNQGSGTQTVDLAGNAAGVLEDAFEGIVAKGEPEAYPAMRRWWWMYSRVSLRSSGENWQELASVGGKLRG